MATLHCRGLGRGDGGKWNPLVFLCFGLPIHVSPSVSHWPELEVSTGDKWNPLVFLRPTHSCRLCIAEAEAEVSGG